MRFYNQFNRPSHTGELNNLPSKTVPDQTMSIKDILDRHTRGLPIAGGKQPIFHGEEEDLPDFKSMDLAEIQEYKEAVQAAILKHQTDYDDQVKTYAEKQKSVQTDKIRTLEERLAYLENPKISPIPEDKR